jgi:hypothetical protein
MTGAAAGNGRRICYSGTIMKTTRTTPRKEPRVEEAVALAPTPPAEEAAMSAEPTVIVPARAVPADGSADQLSRIEEKTARIEEKFARQEAVFGRAQDALDRAAERVEQAAKSVDAVELANEVTALKARIDKTPQTATLVLAGLVTSIATACVFVLLLKVFPGLIR